MLSAVADALTSLISMIGEVVSNIVNAPANGVGGALHALLPLFAIGIAIAVFAFAIRAVRSIVWGA